MKSYFHKIALHKRAISCLLIPAFLFLTLFPFHYHLQHVADADVHESSIYSHAIDLHVLADIDDPAHHTDSHTIDPASYATLKLSVLQLPLFILAFTLLVFSLPAVQHVRYNLASLVRSCSQHNRYTTPPLRAPPRA
ncbi:MAG: hypothetical protein OEU91_00900 [Gammaproteobacteria bacterium]|nr:hypothetical protein [Gammaproteobacteria bacterium]